MNIVLIGSDGQCGIHEYSLVLREGFQALGHRARYIGVKNWDNADLFRKLRQIAPDDDAVVFEYEPGIFHLGALARAAVQARFVRRKRVMLSVHEIEPSKFPGYHRIQWRLKQHAQFAGPTELVRLTWATTDVALQYFFMRVSLALLGWIPHVISVHSPKASENIGLMLSDRCKIVYTPLAIKSQNGDRVALRADLGLPSDRFLFICPGFLFRRKRILETIQQLPTDAELLVVGLPSQYDPGYLEEMQAYLAEHPEKKVHLIQDYANMERYLLAADAVVLYYQDVYQSAIACLALGAGKPCVFSDLPAFAEYKEAGLFVQTLSELHQAMKDIQRSDVYVRRQAGAFRLRDELKPERIAARYLNALTQVA